MVAALGGTRWQTIHAPSSVTYRSAAEQGRGRLDAGQVPARAEVPRCKGALVRKGLEKGDQLAIDRSIRNATWVAVAVALILGLVGFLQKFR
jgi:hypothetical protein